MRRPTQNQLQKQVDNFNRRNPVGDYVYYYSIMSNNGEPQGEPLRLKVSHKAFILSGHTPVVFLEKFSGCVAIKNCVPVIN